MIQSILLYTKRLTGLYRWEEVQMCNLCGGQQFKRHSRHRYGLLPLHLQTCSHCGLIMQNPRLDKESLESFYRNEYRFKLRRADADKHCEKMFERGLRRGAYICNFLKENRIEYRGSVVFEVGCSYGGTLEEFRRSGCRVKGCDIGEGPVGYGISRGLDLVVGPAGELTKLGYKADIVILSHVLEHIPEPNLFLERVRQVLKVGGVLYVEVPGIENLRLRKRRDVQPGHLIYFNRNTLCRMVEKNGFGFLAGNEIVQGLFRKKEVKR